jgi:hypothetical protein
MAEERSSEDGARDERPTEEEGPSDLDAMGQDKRRGVVGQQYGATVRKQLTVYGIVLAVIILGVIGFLTVVDKVDNRDIPLEDTAPWAQADAQQSAPRDLDYNANGPEDTIPEKDINGSPPVESSNGSAEQSSP